MKQEIKLRRLYAFFNSKVLNALMIVIIVSLLMMAYSESMTLPVTCGTIALAFFIGYSLWLWIMKPKSIVISRWLSNISSAYLLYYLIIAAFYPVNQLWLIAPIACSVVVFAIAIMSNKNTNFDI